MIEGKKYDVFQSPKQNLAEQNPELSFIVNKMYFDNEAGVKLDTILRYVVYFYDRRCEMLPQGRILNGKLTNTIERVFHLLM